jgi:hypothetical protein
MHSIDRTVEDSRDLRARVAFQVVEDERTANELRQEQTRAKAGKARSALSRTPTRVESARERMHG